MLSFIIFALAAVAAALPNRASSLIASDNTALPSTFKWTSSDALVSPKKDTRNYAAIKDPSIIYYNNAYHVFASTAQSSGYNLVYFNFTNFASANTAPFYYLDQSKIGTGYRAAPEVFYFAPQKLWYLIYQNGNAAYSTNTDIRNPAGWTAPKSFYSGTPALIEKGLEGGYWVDMWVICDETDCHLFSSDDNGRLYRSHTSVADFPKGMSEPVIALQDIKDNLFEASNVYTVGNATNPTYLLLVECISTAGLRYFRSWTSTSLSGNWTALAATERNPFMGEVNVQFANGNKWTRSFSHGEIVRSNVDQRLRIEKCGWEYLYQGIDPAATGNYNSLPWKLGVLTEVGGC